MKSIRIHRGYGENLTHGEPAVAGNHEARLGPACHKKSENQTNGGENSFHHFYSFMFSSFILFLKKHIKSAENGSWFTCLAEHLEKLLVLLPQISR